MSGRVTRKLVSHELGRQRSPMFQGPPKETFGSLTISPASHENVDHVSVLVNGSPQIVTAASDLDEELISEPDIAQATLLAAQ